MSKGEKLFLILFGYCLVPATKENKLLFFTWAKYKYNREKPMWRAFPRATCLTVMPTDNSHKFPLAAKMSSDGGAYLCACGITGTAGTLDHFTACRQQGSSAETRFSQMTLDNWFTWDRKMKKGAHYGESGCQGLGWERMNRWAQRVFKALKLLCVIRGYMPLCIYPNPKNVQYHEWT